MKKKKFAVRISKHEKEARKLQHNVKNLDIKLVIVVVSRCRDIIKYLQVL